MTGAGESGGPPARPAAGRRARPSFNRDVQRTAMTQLTIGVAIFATLLFGAVYMTYIRPVMQRSPRVVQPVIEAYLDAGADQDVVAAHSLFSEAGIRSTSRDDLAARFADRSLYAGYTRLFVDAFEIAPAGARGPGEVAVVDGTVTYADQPPAVLHAELERENGLWRLRTIDVARSAAP